jgi:hypothetical protein
MYKKLIYPLFLLLYCSNTSAQITVSADGTADFRSIQSAIDKASKGTEITVKSGTYIENIVMKDSIFIYGEDLPVIDGNGHGIVVTMANNCTLAGFKIRNSGSNRGVNDCGVMVDNAHNCKIILNHIVENGHFGIIARNGEVKAYMNIVATNNPVGIYLDHGASFDIAFNYFIKEKHSAIDINENVSGTIYNNNFISCSDGLYYGNSTEKPFEIDVFNNIFVYNETALECVNNTFRTVQYNCFFENGKNQYSILDNTVASLDNSNIYKDPLFSDPENFDLGLKPNSPCVDKGYMGLDIGASNYFSGNEKDACKDFFIKPRKAKYQIELSGTAINHTAGDKSAKFAGILLSDDGINYVFEGQYDNRNLFGHIVMNGKKDANAPDGTLTIRFDKGECYLGNDNSGYPNHTIMPHFGYVTITKDKATGHYTCGILKPYTTTEQYGKYQFDKVESNVSLSKAKDGQ